MVEGKLDLRIERTYKSLCDAFARLLAQRPYEDVTVSDLCAEAMIRRTTFYKHFADKQEFFAFYIRCLREEFQRRADAKGVDDGLPSHVARMVHELVAFLEENGVLVYNCMASTVHGALDDVLAREIAAAVADLLAQEPGRRALPSGASFTAEFVAGGVIHTLHCWKREHTDDMSPAEIEAALCAVIAKVLG